MKKICFQSIIFLTGVFFLLSCTPKQQIISLFNGKNLENWDIYLGTSLGGDFDSLANAAVPEKVFSVVTHNGEPLIRISGEINGSLATKESYENYHLQLIFRWGDKVYSRRNSGLLYHSFGDFGTAYGTWMTNIEFQLMHENLGDTYLMVNTVCETSVEKDIASNSFIYSPGNSKLSFGEDFNGRSIKKCFGNENPLGQWNSVDLYCFGSTAVHVVNGQVVMINQNTGIIENGVIKPLRLGKIQIQSEGAELFIKKIDIEPISKLPKKFMSKI